MSFEELGATKCIVQLGQTLDGQTEKWADVPCRAIDPQLRPTKVVCQKLTDVIQRFQCEDSILELSCRQGKVLDIVSAHYGRDVPGSERCSGPSNDNKYNTHICPNGMSDVTGTLRKLCQHRESCSMLPTHKTEEFPSGVFPSDPCYGIFKYAEVNYRCKELQPRIEKKSCTVHPVGPDNYRLIQCDILSNSALTNRWRKDRTKTFIYNAGYIDLFWKKVHSLDDARDECAAAGGSLPEPKNEIENQILADVGNYMFYLGITDTQKEGDFRYISDDLPITWDYWAKWATPPNPPFDDTNRNCVAMKIDFRDMDAAYNPQFWENWPCYSQTFMKVVCQTEKYQSSITPLGANHYKVELKINNWNNAQDHGDYMLLLENESNVKQSYVLTTDISTN